MIGLFYQPKVGFRCVGNRDFGADFSPLEGPDYSRVGVQFDGLGWIMANHSNTHTIPSQQGVGSDIRTNKDDAPTQSDTSGNGMGSLD